MKGRTWEGIWRLADPKITLASLASMFLGASAAARDGPLAWGWLAATVAGIFFLEAAKNASGELIDYASGTDQAVAAEDRSPFSGGKRVIVEGLLTPGETAAVAWTGYALGIGVGLLIVAFRESAIFYFGLVGVALAFFYHAPPLRLSYRGFGELAVGLCYGPLIGCGTYLVQRGRVTMDAVLATVPLGLLIAAFLWINEFPDYEADRGAGKRTLVVRLGRAAASRVFAWIVGAAFAWLLFLPLAGLPRTVWLGAAGLPFAAAAARRLCADPDATPRLIAAQGWALLAFAILAIGVGVGLLLSRAG